MKTAWNVVATIIELLLGGLGFSPDLPKFGERRPSGPAIELDRPPLDQVIAGDPPTPQARRFKAVPAEETRGGAGRAPEPRG